MQIVLKDLDQTRIRYEAMIHKVGEGTAAIAFSRALNHEGKIGLTAVRKALITQTSIPRGMVYSGTKFQAAHKGNLQTIISARGSELPLRIFKAKQFRYGVRAKVWGRFQTYKSNFIVKTIGDVFHRTSSERFPIQHTFGPSIPKEMVKDASLQAFEASSSDVMTRALHELSRLLKV